MRTLERERERERRMRAAGVNRWIHYSNTLLKFLLLKPRDFHPNFPHKGTDLLRGRKSVKIERKRERKREREWEEKRESIGKEIEKRISENVWSKKSTFN